MLIDPEPLRVLVIPKYITRVKVSNKRRAKYFKKESKKALPQKYRKPGYFFDKFGILRDQNNEKVIANPKVVGTPRYEILSGNKIVTGYGSHHTRNKVSNALKDFFRPFARTLAPFEEEDFPLRVEWDFYTSLDRINFDLSNFWFYYKYFEDSLHEKKNPVTKEELIPILPDDNVQYITHPPGPRLIPVDSFEDRRFVFRFYHDNRIEITKNNVWSNLARTQGDLF